MRENRKFGTFVHVTMMLFGLIALPRLVPAQAPREAEPAASEPTVKLTEPVTDLPTAPAPQIDSITLFPNRGEITSGARFNDQRFGYVLHGEAQEAYDSNIFIKPANEQADFIFTISPGVAVGWGDFKSELFGPGSFRKRFERYVGKNYIFADYTPSWTSFVDHSEENSFNHNARIQGEWLINRLTLGVRGQYITQNVPDEDVGDRVNRRIASVALTSSYDYSGKTAIEVNNYFRSVDYNGTRVSTQDWRNEDWLAYQITPKINLGIGGAIAHENRDSEASQTYEHALLRLKYDASEKLAVELSGGAEFRQVEGGQNRNDGIFTLDVSWTPTDSTSIALEGYRESLSSGTRTSSYYTATGVSLQCRQRIFHRFFFDITVGYQNSEYHDAIGVNEARTDDLYFIQPGLGFDLTSWLNCEITGEYRKSDSSLAQRNFDVTRAAMKFNVLF